MCTRLEKKDQWFFAYMEVVIQGMLEFFRAKGGICALCLFQLLETL